MSEHLNKVNCSMQGRKEDIFASSDKISTFKYKIKLWKTKINEDNVDIFPRAAEKLRHKGFDL